MAYVDASVNREIERMGDLTVESRVQDKMAQFRAGEKAEVYNRWSAEMLKNHAILFVRKDISREIGLKDFDTWSQQRS
jgi:hypothetical protein